MALHEFGRPALPILQKPVKSVLAGAITVAAEQLARGGRSACARIEKGDVDFALRERPIDERQITDDSGEETKTEAGFADDKRASEAGAGNDIAEAESEKRGTAEIDVCSEAWRTAGDVDR